MKDTGLKVYPAHIAGAIVFISAAGIYFLAPLAAAVLLVAYVILCIVACFFPGTNFLGPVISRGLTRERKVALTFDDGPSEQTTLKILDLLDRHKIKATFLSPVSMPGDIPRLFRKLSAAATKSATILWGMTLC